ncbi:MAG: C40 family peptidase [Bacteroidetes bacterium]|nr:C40 family peptidase [Bacteroidota bacterium]
MEFGICLQSVIPVRAVPSHKSEMVTQLLFGEHYRILRKEQDWLRIQLAYDNYEGWMHANQSTPLGESEFLHLFNIESSVTIDLVQLLSNETKRYVLPVMMGSSLPGLDGHNFTIGNETFNYDGLLADSLDIEKAITPRERVKAKQTLVDDALLYLNAPYLWGGRTPFGIDCSGFVQMVYKLKKIKLLRDASQQAAQGESLNFVSETEPGDLAFFDDEEGNIIHVGILLDQNRIIHASGKVRIDLIDHEGIYNEKKERYTHKLRLLKRII